MNDDTKLLDALREYQRSLCPEPDYTKGKTAAEWAKAWGVSSATARRQLAMGVEAGKIVCDRDIRRVGERQQYINVYRRAEGFGKES